MSDELVRRARQVIQGNDKPTVVLSQAEAVALLARAEAAEAELAIAVQALGEIATDEHPLGWIAITALAEIKGESHE